MCEDSAVCGDCGVLLGDGVCLGPVSHGIRTSRTHVIDWCDVSSYKQCVYMGQG